LYLKRLDVQGFKSFANKTTLDFTPGVTCVVGPNGTGKTNVTDSIRWVLGEHSSRQLRARKTEDVIFVGSDQRAPMGVAEVAITLDNEQGWLPIDFSEVVVSRRAYRSGDNEYFINHSKVRLRDVIELFQRAELGQNSYAFMGQGMVEQALSLRPEDRRALIEEAADVRVHRHKLEGAREKLKATRDNLDRVQLLVGEIAPRINQLERQAGRAVRYRELTRELASTLHVWYGHEWREANEQLLAAEAAHDQTAEAFGRLQTGAKTCEDGLAQLSTAIDTRRREIVGREERLRAMEDYARDLERRTAIDGDRRQLLEERLQEVVAELASLREEQAAQEAAAAPAGAEGATQLESERAELTEWRARLATVERELLEKRQSLRSDEQAAADADDAGARTAARLPGVEEALQRSRHEHAAAAERRHAAITSLAGWALEYARARADSVELAPRIAAAEEERARAATQLDALRGEHPAAEEELRALRSRIEAAEIRLEVLESLNVHPTAPDAGVRTVLEAGGVIKRESVPAEVQLSGVLGLVGQLLRVPPGLEKAIEAALADNLFAIVVQREPDMRRALQLLLAGDGGRATLYALDSFQENRPLHLIKERGVIGVASQLVRCDSKYRRLVDTLLGRTVIVEDLPMAQRLLRRGMASAVATLDGLLLRPVGSVSAGATAIVETSFVRERDLDELPQELARLRPLAAEREATLRDAAPAAEETERRVREASASLDALRERESRAATQLASAHARLATFRADLLSITATLTRAAEEAGRLEQSCETMTVQRDTAVARKREAQSGADAARAALSGLETEREALTAAVSERAAALAHLEGELQPERHLAGARAARERLAQHIAAKEQQEERLAGEAQTVAARLQSAQREFTERTADIEGLRGELEPARQELTQLQSRERSLTAELATANAQMHTAERALLDAENNVRVRRDEVASLRESLEAEGFVATADGDVEAAPPPPEDAAPDGAGGVAQGNGNVPTWMRSGGNGEGGLPPVSGGAPINATEVRDRIVELRAQIRGLGPVNEQAAADYGESRERYDFLTSQLADLRQTEEQLHEAIRELETVIRERFRETFKIVGEGFEHYFTAFFRGGTGRLELGEPDEYGLPGVEIIAQPPGKKLGSMALLSGGERALTAVALLFALLQANPSPICVLDEVDAALDEANVGRFVDELRELSKRTQFVIITHNRRTIEQADTIYGISMGADSVSRILSLRLADIPAEITA